MQKKLPIWFLPLVIGTAVVVAMMFVRGLVLDTQRDRILSETQAFATGLSSRLETNVLVRLGVIELLRTDWERGQIMDLDEFRAAAMSVHQLFDDLQALNWVNPQGVIEVVTPLEGNEAALGLDIRRLPAPSLALTAAARTGNMRLTPPITLAQGGMGFVAYIPMRHNQIPLGFLNIVFRAGPMIDNAVGSGDEKAYDITIKDGDIPLSAGNFSADASDLIVQTQIMIGGRTWDIQTSPTWHTVEAAESLVDEVVLFAGLFLAFLTGVLSYSAAAQQRALQDSEERFSLALKGANDGLWDWDLTTDKAYFSPRYFEMLGYEPGELASDHNTFTELLHPGDREETINHPTQMIAGEDDVMESEFRMRHKDGSWVNILSRANLVRDNGKVSRIVGTHIDVTERKKNETALKRAQEILREGTEALPVGFAFFDGERRLLVCNGNYSRLVSSQMQDVTPGMRLEEFVDPSTPFATSREIALQGADRDDAMARWTYERADGLWIEASERITGSGSFIQVIWDVTEARRNQERLQQTHKMEAVGQLTGGIAHDFNNLLAVIMGNAELLEESDTNSAPITSAIVHAAMRGAELTQRLLAFSRKQPLHPEVVDLAELIDGTRDMLQRTLGETVRIETDTKRQLWGALADPGQVENAILNLALNARDAMTEGGVLTIECENVTVATPAVPGSDDVEAGDYVVLSVRDEGTGMSERVRQQAFEPFFTTKDVGEGSGLGLSMVYGFAQQSGGQARIESAEGKGTTVMLYLPRAAKKSDEPSTTTRSEVPKGGGETILVIEDDPAVRKLVCSMLERLGYAVISAERVGIARHIISTIDSVQLVLSDVVLPGGASGPDFASELRIERPDLQVIFMSGYPASELGRGGAPTLDGVLLNKPFGIKQLAGALSEALNA